jgi:hypothetical protein
MAAMALKGLDRHIWLEVRPSIWRILNETKNYCKQLFTSRIIVSTDLETRQCACCDDDKSGLWILHVPVSTLELARTWGVANAPGGSGVDDGCGQVVAALRAQTTPNPLRTLALSTRALCIHD